MKKTFILIIILISSISCKDKLSIDYANDLSTCMNSNDIELLNEACQIFEENLKERYNGIEIGEAYIQFLKDLEFADVPTPFFLSHKSKQILQKIKDSKTFEKIWIKQSLLEKSDNIEIIEFASAESKEEYWNDMDFYCTNPNGEYLDCLIKNNKNESVIDFLDIITTEPGLSPIITSKSILDNLKNNEYNNGLIRLMITTCFYYEIGLIIEKQNTVGNTS